MPRCTMRCRCMASNGPRTLPSARTNQVGVAMNASLRIGPPAAGLFVEDPEQQDPENHHGDQHARDHDADPRAEQLLPEVALFLDLVLQRLAHLLVALLD